MDRVTRVVGSAFGLGFLPVAPGTWGTLGTIAVAWLIPAGFLWPLLTTILFLAACGATLVLGTHAEIMTGVKDPGFIVLDEVAGSLVALASLDKPPLWWFIGAFLFFRLFDVLKPWPCRRFERFAGGLGILVDDVTAGFYAALVLMTIRAVAPRLGLPLA